MVLPIPQTVSLETGHMVTMGEGGSVLYGDANCDGAVTVSDVIYIINCLFKGGPASCSPSAR